ncbi:hypothetical protein RHSIM_Rhsim02G0111500 [Rhododendron simsii]|uniref:Ubiquitin-like protease family profile domain-containing protein n=1 Tax=Rhododendron simsii TaxID=118357 RepID=A0A834H9H4_RHOSS|nr:hypothetical protein RHSIM_Rhsim02G0111500 [Rhododendron simsii]
MEKCGSQTGVAIDQQKLNMDEEVQVQEEVMENQRKVDGEGEQVEVQVHVDEGVVQECALTRPSKKRGNRTVKVSALFNVLKRTRLMDYPWKNWIIHHSDVLQQNNIFDCGFYTLRFMEHWTGGRMNAREQEANMGVDMRMRLLVRLYYLRTTRGEMMHYRSADKNYWVKRK